MSSADDDKRRKYRASTLGQTMGQALLELANEGMLSRKEAARILELFDVSIYARVNRAGSSTPSVESASLEGELEYYNCYNGLWHLRVKNARTTLPHVPVLSVIEILADEVPRHKKRDTAF